MEINIYDLRLYIDLKGGKIDDIFYGGGVGMLMIYLFFYKFINKLKIKDMYIVLLLL